MAYGAQFPTQTRTREARAISIANRTHQGMTYKDIPKLGIHSYMVGNIYKRGIRPFVARR